MKGFDKIFRTLERNINKLFNQIITTENIEEVITRINDKGEYLEKYNRQKDSKKSSFLLNETSQMYYNNDSVNMSRSQALVIN